MKLLRYGEPGQEKPGLIDDSGTLRELSAHFEDIAGEALSDAALDRLRGLDPASLPAVEGDPRIGPCVGRVGKFMCIGLNYSDHAAETGAAIPEHPILFMKATSAIIGPNDNVVMPRGSSSTAISVSAWRRNRLRNPVPSSSSSASPSIVGVPPPR